MNLIEFCLELSSTVACLLHSVSAVCISALLVAVNLSACLAEYVRAAVQTLLVLLCLRRGGSAGLADMDKLPVGLNPELRLVLVLTTSAAVLVRVSKLRRWGAE